MIVRRSETPVNHVENCHEGTGHLACVEMLQNYGRKGPGFKYLHNNVLEPGASIGAHEHTVDEEIYLFLEGEGEMIEDGKPIRVTAGDMCITTPGHSHGLTNTGAKPMWFIVVCTNL